MSEQIETKGSMMPPSPPHMPNMVAPTFMQRLCQLLHRQVTVVLATTGSAPLTGTLHAVGQDYLELVTGTNNNNQVMIVPLWNVGVVMAAGAMNDICPPIQPPPCTTSPGMGGGGCPMPGGECPPPMTPPGMWGGMPGMMDVKDTKK